MKRFSITGLGCAACVARVEKATNAVPGVESCSVSLLTNEMLVEGNANSAEIVSAVEKAGYGCSEIIEENKEDDNKPEDEETSKLLIRLIVSAILLAVQMICMRRGIKYAEIVICIAVMIINRRFFISGFKSIIHASPNMDALVAIGSLAAFVYGYFDSASMILTFITVGKTLESVSKGRTTNALKDLIEMAPKTDLKTGDEFEVFPGNKFPADAVVIEGAALVDESMLTGESDPVEKNKGDKVCAATLNRKGTVKCRATAVGEDTTLARIIRLVSDTAATKAPIARTADKVAAVFVPCVIGIAILVTVIWLLIGQPFGTALERGISVLVISCPCAMGLATPVAVMVASGRGAKNGILFKTAASIEETGRIQAVALDKTGTLTYGSKEISDLESLEGSSEEIQTRANTLRPEAAEAVGALRKLGLEVWMITGDREQKAKEIAASCGIENVIWEVLPGGKSDAVATLQKDGRKVVMVGDGINDAPALTKADVGIAVGTGTDVAIDSADIVVMKGDLADVVSAIKLSRATLRNIRQNLFWAFFYNIIAIPVAAGALSGLGINLTPGIAALCMSLSSVCVVTNALRLNIVDIKDKA